VGGCLAVPAIPPYRLPACLCGAPLSSTPQLPNHCGACPLPPQSIRHPLQATAIPGSPPAVTPAATSVGALALGAAPLPEVPEQAIAPVNVTQGPAAEAASQPLAQPQYSASGSSAGGEPVEGSGGAPQQQP